MSDSPTFSDQPPAAPAHVPDSSTALISLIAGILGLTFLPLIGSIVALITGYSARREIQESGGTLGGDGMAQAGIILGWIGVGLAVIGACITGVVLLIPICLATFFATSGEWGAVLPLLLTFL
jgi:hypothetical protein